MTQHSINYKDSGIAWIGDIPNTWKISKLKFIFRYITWATPDSWKSNYYWWDKNWITISDLNWKYTWGSKNKITDLAVKEKNMKIVPKWSLLYSFKLSVWQLAFVNEDTYTNEAIFGILPKEWLNLNFWYYALGSYFINNSNENIYWAKIFNQFYIDNWLVVVPPFLSQTTIAKYLDTKTDHITIFIAKKKQLILLLQEQKQAIIHKAVTKGVEEWVTMRDSGIEWIGQIPEAWEIVKLKYVSKIINGSTPSSWEQEYWDWDIDWITPTDLWNSNDPYLYSSVRKITKLWLKNCWTTIVQEKSIILSCRAPIWSLWITTKEMCTNQWCKSLIPTEKIHYMHLYYYFVAYNDYIQSMWKWTTFQELSTTDLSNSLIILPTIEDQNKIIKYIESHTSKIDQTIAKIEQEISLIEEYRKSLIYHAVTGKINVQ